MIHERQLSRDAERARLERQRDDARATRDAAQREMDVLSERLSNLKAEADFEQRGPVVTLAEVCNLLHFSPQHLHNIRNNPRKAFPKPWMDGRVPKWFLEEILDWAREQRKGQE